MRQRLFLIYINLVLLIMQGLTDLPWVPVALLVAFLWLVIDFLFRVSGFNLTHKVLISVLLVAGLGYWSLDTLKEAFGYPPLIVVIDRSCPDFQQVNTYRICVVNRSHATIDDVRAKIVGIDPQPDELLPKQLPLHFMKEGDLSPEPCQTFSQSIAPAETVPIDVAEYNPLYPDKIRIYHCTHKQPQFVANRGYQLTIQIIARNLRKPVVITVAVGFDEAGEFFMRRAAPGNEGHRNYNPQLPAASTQSSSTL